MSAVRGCRSSGARTDLCGAGGEERGPLVFFCPRRGVGVGTRARCFASPQPSPPSPHPRLRRTPGRPQHTHTGCAPPPPPPTHSPPPCRSPLTSMGGPSSSSGCASERERECRRGERAGKGEEKKKKLRARSPCRRAPRRSPPPTARPRPGQCEATRACTHMTHRPPKRHHSLTIHTHARLPHTNPIHSLRAGARRQVPHLRPGRRQGQHPGLQGRLPGPALVAGAQGHGQDDAEPGRGRHHQCVFIFRGERGGERSARKGESDASFFFPRAHLFLGTRPARHARRDPPFFMGGLPGATARLARWVGAGCAGVLVRPP